MCSHTFLHGATAKRWRHKWVEIDDGLKGKDLRKEQYVLTYCSLKKKPFDDPHPPRGGENIKGLGIGINTAKGMFFVSTF